MADNVNVTMGISAERINVVQRQAEKWANELVDLDYRNTMLYYRDTKTGLLDLTHANQTAVESLLSGGKTRLGALFVDPEKHKAACLQARNLRKKLVQLDEEQGVEAGRLARGLFSVDPRTHQGFEPCSSAPCAAAAAATRDPRQNGR
jgi:hypothetical protein